MLKSSVSALLLPCGLFLGMPMVAQQTGVEAGQQLYRAHCFVCHGLEGDTVPGVAFRSGQFRRASTDDDLSRLILGGIPGTAMPPTNLPEPQRQSLVAYIRSMRRMGSERGSGDAARGLALLEGKGGCMACHRVGAKGAIQAPDLSEIGSVRTAAYLEQSLLDPNAVIAPQYRYVLAVTKQGAEISGRRLNEDTHTIQLIDQRDRLVSLDKADLKQLTLMKTSRMPSYEGKLSVQEIEDLVSYLLSLKGSQ